VHPYPESSGAPGAEVALEDVAPEQLLGGGSAETRSVPDLSRDAHQDSSVTVESDGTEIRTPDQRLRVFVSSTLGELADERAAVSGASDEVYAAGSRLNRREAVAAVRDRPGVGTRAS
jgi:hypothetical protein